ncbi:MAG: TetR family transcriptional regulator [Gammaproteobacteria bacterium]|nr:TetR family transcriptional regulator [Gammaproteobacteria bacterium]
MSKGDDTRQAILQSGLEMASRIGLEQVTIGNLARQSGLSKSGLYAHFQAKETLQIEILQLAGQIFAASVLLPALRGASGIDRIRRVVANWCAWNENLSGGCVFASACNEYRDRPGRVRDFVVAQQREWLASLQRLAQSAVEIGDFRSDIDSAQFAYDLYASLLGFHLFRNMLDLPEAAQRQEQALEQLLDNYR